MGLPNLISFLGIFVILVIAWLFSSHRKRVKLRTILAGILLQLLLGFFVFVTPIGTQIFLRLSDLVVKLLNASQAGSQFVFGPLAFPPGTEGSLGFILITQALPTVVFFAALMGGLYYLRVMPFLVRQFAKLFTRVMKVSGAESLCAASNIFVGIESATTILPYLKKMTRSELLTVLTAGLATIASSMLGFYTLLLKDSFPHIAGHLISASLLSAPAAIVMAKILMPEVDQPETLGLAVEAHYERESSLIEAIIRGATAGGKLVFGIVVLLIAFLGLVELINIGLDGIHFPRLEQILTYPFYPLALIIGVAPADALEVARLLGERVILTEIPSYRQLAEMVASETIQPRSALLTSYALCGFAHVSSIAIFVGGIAALVPERTRDLASLALRALLAATLACLMTAAVAGTFYGHGSLLV